MRAARPPDEVAFCCVNCKPDLLELVGIASEAKDSRSCKPIQDCLGWEDCSAERRVNAPSCCPPARYFAVNPKAFLLLNLALAFYNVGTIWAHEIDIFRSWKFVDATRFQEMHYLHWRKLPYWIFTPVGIAFLGGIVLVWYHPANSPMAAPLGAVLC
jgi:hypothetical protein